MRKPQLDASIPRQVRGSSTIPNDEQPKVNYIWPLIATLAASIMVVLFVAVLTFFTSTVTSQLIGNGDSAVLGGLCGMLALVFFASTLFFIYSTYKVVRDFFTPLQVRRGVVVGRQAGRGMGGANWISIRWEDEKPLGAPLQERTTVTRQAETPKPIVKTGSTVVRPATAKSDLSFGAQLNKSSGGEPAAAIADDAARLDEAMSGRIGGREAKGKALRVDRHVYDALAVGDEVIVGYSRHIEHVYYVKRLSDHGNSLLLRNLSLV